MSTPLHMLLPYQQRWVGDDSQVKLYEKSRRIGISWASACEAAIVAGSATGMDVWYVGYNREMAEEFIRDTADWLKNMGQLAEQVNEEVFNDGDRDILSFVIRCASGFRVTALSSKPNNLRGKQGLVILDEAAFHDRLDELLKAAMALLMWGGRVAIISTHDGVDNPFNQLIEEIRAGKKPYSLHRTTLDDALSDGLFKRICAVGKRTWSAEAEAAWRQDLLDFYGDAANEELFCIPRQSGGAYLMRSLIEARMVDAPVLRLTVNDEFAHLSDAAREMEVSSWCEDNLKPLLQGLDSRLRHGFGEDFGRSGDLTVIAPCQQTQQMLLRFPFLVELRNVPFRQQEQILFYIADRLPRFSAGALDARGNGQYLAEVSQQRFGTSRIHQVMLSDKWYLENLPPFKAAFEDASIEIPRDADIVDDLRALQVINGVPKLPKTNTGRGAQRHGDAAIALAMAHFAMKQDAWSADWQGSGHSGSLGLNKSTGWGSVGGRGSY